MATRKIRKKVKVPLFGATNKAAFVDDGATQGAQIGVDLLLPDGSVPTLAELAAALGVGTSSGGSSSGGSGVGGLAATLWNLVGAKPDNILEAAALTGDGILYRAVDGSWSTDGALVDLADVLIVAPVDGSVLTWDDGAQLWVAAAPSSGGGGYPAELGYAGIL